MTGMKKKISFCIAYALQIRLHILLDYGMLQSHFSHEVYALQTSAPCPGEETFFSRAGKAMVCHAGCHAGSGSSERLYQLISTDQGRGKEKNLSLKSAAPNENQHSRSLQWHMIAHQWLSVRRCLFLAVPHLCHYTYWRVPIEIKGLCWSSVWWEEANVPKNHTDCPTLKYSSDDQGFLILKLQLNPVLNQSSTSITSPFNPSLPSRT